MVKDNRRIAPPSNCISPNTFKNVSEVKSIINDVGLRLDDRKPEDIRPISLKVGIVPSVTGSAYLESGNTRVIVSINGPRDVLHKTDSSTKGQLFCEFKYAMFSCKERQSYMPTDEEHIISKAIQDALEPVVLLHKFPKARLDISIVVLENNGGAISCAFTCAGAALSNAGVEMYDLPIGCSLLYCEDHVLMDPTYEEENFKGITKVTVAMMPAYNDQVIFMDCSGSLKPALLSKSLKSLQSSCQTILSVIKDFLKQHLKVSNSTENQDLECPIDEIQAAQLKIFQPQKYINAFLENNIRPDERELNEFRPILITIGSINTAYGSALVRLGDTAVICGIKADLTNPSADEPNKGFFVPNVTLTPICGNKFQPGPPTEQAQVYSQLVMDVVKSSNFIDLSDLCIEEGKLSWCLFAEMFCLSYDGNILDACVMSLMAALKNTKLPEVTIHQEESKIEVSNKSVSLNIKEYVFLSTFAVLKDKTVADPSMEEENLADGTITIFLKEDGSTSIQSFGSVKLEQISSCIQNSKSKYLDMKALLESVS